MKKHGILFWLFALIFLLGSFYIVFQKTEKYQSDSIVSIRDLSGKQNISSIGSVLLGQGDISTKQDSELLILYVQSHEMYDRLDQEFNLTAYYSGPEIDFAQRLYPESRIPFLVRTRENLIRQYHNDLTAIYDDLSGTLHLSFFHADPIQAQRITRRIVQSATDAINRFDKENAAILVEFLQKQEQKYKRYYMESIKKIIAFQNRAGLIDPQINIKANSELLAQLESERIKAEVDYQSKRVRLTPHSPVIKALKKQIEELDRKIRHLRATLAGDQPTSDKERLNKDQFVYETLKKELEFNTELYKQTLFKLEDARISASLNAKNLITISAPSLPQQYSRPNKVREVLSLGIILLFLYGIIRTSLLLLREHKD